MFNLKSKTFWKYALIILVFPVVVNLLLFQYKLPWVFGTADNWLSFWGNYTGGIISAFVAFYIANDQIKKQILKEKFDKQVNQLPALVRLKNELEGYIDELKRVKIEREEFIANNGEGEKLDIKHYNIKPVEQEDFSLLKLVENVDLHVDLITCLSFYRDFANALQYNIDTAGDRLKELVQLEMKMGRMYFPSELLREMKTLDEEIEIFLKKKRNNWNTFYEKNMLDKFSGVLARLSEEIEFVKKIKEKGDLSLIKE